MTSRNIYTVTTTASKGAVVTPPSAEFPYSRLCVGESGRGRKLAWLPLAKSLALPKCDCFKCHNPSTCGCEICHTCRERSDAKCGSFCSRNNCLLNDKDMQKPGCRWACPGIKYEISSADVIVTQKGNHLLVAAQQQSDDCIVVLKVPAGYRGGVTYCTYAPQVGHLRKWQRGVDALVTGIVADGAAGGMGSNEEHICVLKRGTIIRATRLGRLYGAEANVFISWDGDNLTVSNQNPITEHALLSDVEAN